MKKSNFLGLKLPAQSDFYNVDDFNENFKAIDVNLETAGGKQTALEKLLGTGGLDGVYDETILGSVREIYNRTYYIDVNAAAFHNGIYRGKYLGAHVTSEQYTAIRNGTFDNLFIGDYWTISGVNWRIAHFDYWYNTGDSVCTSHHAVIVPDAPLYNAQMHNTASGQYEDGTTANTTAGGYVGSDMYTKNLATAKNAAIAAFGSGHILTHRELLINAVSDGYSSGHAWYDSTVELMNECMTYGSYHFAPGGNGTRLVYRYTIDNSQLALFKLDRHAINMMRNWYWLRDVVTAEYFASVGGYGYSDSNSASTVGGVRPAFPIY